MSTYDWLPTFLLFGPTGAGKTKFASYLRKYRKPDGSEYRLEIADIGRGLFSWDPPPEPNQVFPIASFEELVVYLAGIEERNNDLILIDDISLLNYKLTMESAQIRQGRDPDTQPDISKLISSSKYNHLNFIPPQIRDRGIASEKLRIMLYNLLDMRKIVLFTCGEKLEAEKIVTSLGDKPIFTGKTYREPNLPGNMPNELPYFVSEVFYMYRRADAKSLTYQLRFQPDGGMVACPKDRSGKMKTLAPNGVITLDEAGQTFDKIIAALPWPDDMRPTKAC